MSGKKGLIVGLSVFIFLLLIILIALSSKKSKKEVVQVQAPVRVTATPYQAQAPTLTPIVNPSGILPTLPLVTATPTISSASPTLVIATPSATPTTEMQLGRLSYLSQNNLLNTDLNTTQTLLENIATEASHLKWSPKGSYLSWVSVNGGSGYTITTYNPELKQRKEINFEGTNLIDYEWSKDEKKIALLYGSATQTISQVSIITGEKSVQGITISPYPVDTLYWLSDGTFLISGKKGIYQYDESTKEWISIVSSDTYSGMALSPDEKMILYSISHEGKLSWFLLERIMDTPTEVTLDATNTDLTAVNLPLTVLDRGLDEKAVWYPDSTRFLISIKYLQAFPIVGEYTIATQKFKSLGIFPLSPKDRIIDPFTLMGERATTINGVSKSQTQFFSLEGNGKLGVVKVLSDANSPAFYVGN